MTPPEKTPPTQRCPHTGHWPSLIDLQNLTNSEHACYFFRDQDTRAAFKYAERSRLRYSAENIYEHEHEYAKPRMQQREKEKTGEEKKTARSAGRQPAHASDARTSRQARSHCTTGRRRAARGRARSARAGGPVRKAGGEANGDARNTGGAATGTKARASATDRRPTTRRGPRARQESPDRPPTHEGAANTGARIPAGATGPAGGPRRAARPC